MASSERIILIDADVVSHFVTAGEAAAIHKVFPNNPVHMLDKVHAELQEWPLPNMLQQISILLSKKHIYLINFPEDNDEIKKEYFWIKNMLFKGDGESACLAVSRYNKQILASSNLRDIKEYCNRHKMDYLTTMDFLCEALRTGLFTEERCNNFLRQVLAATGKLPVKNMKDYNCRSINFL
jgi:hypothetical protein